MVDSSSENRKCQKCGILKGDDDFYANQGNTCKKCVQAATRANRRANPERYRATRRTRERKNPNLGVDRRKQRIKRRYGLTPESVEELLQAQGGKCAICRVPLISPFIAEDDGTKVRPVVDHNHRDGHVRGLLCPACNTGLGQFEDNPKIVKKAYQYLKRDEEDVEVKAAAVSESKRVEDIFE